MNFIHYPLRGLSSPDFHIKKIAGETISDEFRSSSFLSLFDNSKKQQLQKNGPHKRASPFFEGLRSRLERAVTVSVWTVAADMCTVTATAWAVG